jgi:O-antigen/teichoic acid export membrane protein
VLKDLSYRVDILIISYFLPAAAVGFYVAAVNLAEIVWKIPDAIGTVLLPRIANIGATSAKLLTPAVSRIVFLIVSSMALFLGLFSQKIIILFFGPQFLPSNIPLLILLPGMIGITVWKIIASDMIAEGYPVEYSLTAMISLITIIILDLLLIPRYGIDGAAFATTIAYSAATVSIIFFYTRLTKVHFISLFVPSRMDLSFYRSMLKTLTTRFNRT